MFASSVGSVEVSDFDVKCAGFRNESHGLAFRITVHAKSRTHSRHIAAHSRNLLYSRWVVVGNSVAVGDSCSRSVARRLALPCCRAQTLSAASGRHRSTHQAPCHRRRSRSLHFLVFCYHVRPPPFNPTARPRALRLVRHGHCVAAGARPHILFPGIFLACMVPSTPLYL